MKSLLSGLAFASIPIGCSGCGGVLDYVSRPIEIHGELVGTRAGAADAALVVADPHGRPGSSRQSCVDLISNGSLNDCRARKASVDPNGDFRVVMPGEMRGCAFLIIPPLLDTFCDEKSYFLIAVPTNPPDVYSVVIASGKAKQSRVNGEGTSKMIIKQISVAPNERHTNERHIMEASKKDDIDLEIDLR